MKTVPPDVLAFNFKKFGRPINQVYLDKLYQYIVLNFQPVHQESVMIEYAQHASTEDIKAGRIIASPSGVKMLKRQKELFAGKTALLTVKQFPSPAEALGTKIKVNVRKCTVCGGSDTEAICLQTRSSDEPSREIWWCNKCNKNF
jgi:DNA-directed RNA polymerase subunit M/transcription elongation factor TFIIS